MHFVIKFFEVISTSALHIYHTAIPLSPQGSTVHKLYDKYAFPLARVVHGLPLLWEPIAGTLHTHGPSPIWSPCNRFIAISNKDTKTYIVDAVTLKKLNTFECDGSHGRQLCFSSDSHLLTHITDETLTSWDLQTGGLVSIIPLADKFGESIYHHSFSSVHSMDGKMIAVAFEDGEQTSFTMATYDLYSRKCLYTYPFSKVRFVPPIWTHGKCIRFATMVPGSMSIWEVGFTSISNLAEVETLLLPDEIQPKGGFLFLPHLFRLAYSFGQRLFIWDAQNSKFLLYQIGNYCSWQMTFSSDGQFFACEVGLRPHLWKETSVGYTVHQNLTMTGSSGSAYSLLSPNGESVIMYDESSVSVLPTRDPIISPSSPQSFSSGNLLFEISPDQNLVALILLQERNITILDLESGDLQLVIDVDMDIVSVKMTENVIVVANCEKVVAWDIPPRHSVLDARVNINNSNCMTMFNQSPWTPSRDISVSPNLNYVAVMLDEGESARHMNIYSTWTGECLTSTLVGLKSWPYFSPDGCEVWSVPYFFYGPAARWVITEESKSCLIKLEQLESIVTSSAVTHHRKSLHGYKVSDDGWLLSPTQNHLLWLPPHWQSRRWEECWQGQFFGFTHSNPLEAVILEFLE